MSPPGPNRSDGDDRQRISLHDLTRAAFDGAPVGMALTSLDANGDRTIRAANEALADFLGTTPGELVGQTFNALTHPDDEPADVEGSARLRAGSDDTVHWRKRYRHRDGHYLWAELHARVVRRADGAVMTLAHIIDIMDRVALEQSQADHAERREQQVKERTVELALSEAELRRALDEAAEQRARLELILDASHSGIGAWDRRSNSIELSDGWYRLLGYAPHEIDFVNTGWEHLVHPDDWPGLEQAVSSAISDGDTTIEHTFRVRHKNGSWRRHHHRGKAIEWDATGVPIHIIGIDTDVTDQYELEQQVMHSAKMESLGAFAGGIAHDFNNVLAIIQGHTEALAPGEPIGNERAGHVDAIQRAVLRATSLVQGLMSLGRPITDLRSPIDLGDSVSMTAASLSQLLGEDIQVSTDVPDDPVVVEIDASRFEAALLNLAANARDAMPTGGDLTIRLIPTMRSGSSVALLVVSDNGVGMDASTKASIFEPFFTTKAPGIGTGLGLATTYASISEANGTIAVESSPGAGTTVSIELPIVDPAPAPDQSVARPEAHRRPPSRLGGPSASAPSGARASVIVVEDEAELLELTTDLLRSTGYRVHGALNAAEALEVLERNDDIGVLLSDVVMPGMSGSELARIVRRRWPSIEILFMSGYAATPATESIDPTRLLTKPVSKQQLIDSVSRLLPTG